MTHMPLWSSVMMQYILTKQAEEKWSLRQYNFLADSRKTVPIACRSEEWIKFQRKSPQTSAGGKSDSPNIFFKNWLTSKSFFPYCLLSPKDCISRHQLCPIWKRNDLTSQPGHTVVTALWMAVSKSAWTLLQKYSHQFLQPLKTYGWIYPHKTLDGYWPVRKMQIARSESKNCK